MEVGRKTVSVVVPSDSICINIDQLSGFALEYVPSTDRIWVAITEGGAVNGTQLPIKVLIDALSKPVKLALKQSSDRFKKDMAKDRRAVDKAMKKSRHR